MRRVVLLSIFCSTLLLAWGDRPCLNPFSTINWRFFFDDLLIGSYGDGNDNPICACLNSQDGVPDVGLKLRLTEPIGFIEIVSAPYRFPCFMKDSSRVAKIKKRGSPQTFRIAHYYQYPVFAVLNLGLDQLCVAKEVPIDIPFLGEVMPQWSNEFVANFLHPENLFVANPIATVACLYDCATATASHPADALTWCRGCWHTQKAGTGAVEGSNPPEEEATLAINVLDWMHLMYMMPQTVGVSGSSFPFVEAVVSNANDLACGKSINYFPKVIKSQYLLQISYPSATEEIIVPGEFAGYWSNFKQIPTYQDRIFTVWRRKVCCMGVAHLLY